MSISTFPPLELAQWRPTRDLLHGYCQVLGRIRRSLAAKQRHWWHISLRATETGVTTAAIPVPESTDHFEIDLDIQYHRLMITSTSGIWWEMPVTGQPPGIFCNQILAALETMGIFPDIDTSALESTDTPYDLSAAHAFGQALARVNTVFSRFKSELPGDRSEVNLWPHHFDLSLMWLSGRKVAGVDPEDEEYADEQMTFGFSTGDEGIPDAYFYATAYPWPPAIVNKSLPPGTTWHTQGWKGGLMMYKSLTEAHNPEEKLLHFLRAAYLAGSTLMI